MPPQELFDINLIENMFAKRIDLIAANVVTHRFEDGRMGDHHRRRTVMYYLLRLLVKRDAAAVILFGARGIDQLFKRLIAPFGGVEPPRWRRYS